MKSARLPRSLGGDGPEADLRSLHKGMTRIVVTPTRVKLIDFETTLPSGLEDLIKERAERQGG